MGGVQYQQGAPGGIQMGPGGGPQQGQMPGGQPQQGQQGGPGGYPHGAPFSGTDALGPENQQQNMQ